MKKRFLIDINGVLYNGGKAIDCAAQAIDSLREKNIPYLFVSNATQARKETLCRKLSSMGFSISEDEIFSAPDAAISYVKKRRGKKAFLISTGDVFEDFLSAGLELTETDPDYVVVGDAGKDFTYETLNKAFNLLLNGAELVAMEKDRFWLSGEGLAMCAGPYVSALEYASGKKAAVVGKPSEEFFTLAAERLGAKTRDCTVIGDDLKTDIAGPKKLGMDAFLVLSGKTRKEDLHDSGIEPDKIMDSIADLSVLL